MLASLRNFNCPLCQINSLGPSDAIWRQRSGSPLAQVMACCLMAPSHYLNQCWLFMNLMLWHPPENNFIGISQNINSINEFENYNFEIITVSSRVSELTDCQCWMWNFPLSGWAVITSERVGLQEPCHAIGDGASNQPIREQWNS